MHRSNSKRGAALLMVMGIIILTSIMSAAILYAAATHHRLASRQIDLEQALYLAEAGLEDAAKYIADNNADFTVATARNGTIGSGSFDALIQTNGFRTYSLVSTGTYSGVSVVLNVERAWLATYAEYAMWSHENGPMYFLPGEEYLGKVHVNDAMYFDSNPTNGGSVFWEDVSSGSGTHYGSTNNVTFHKRFVRPRSMSSLASVSFAELENKATSFGLVLEGETDIKLAKDKVHVWNDRAGWSDHHYTLSANEIIFVKNAISGDPATVTGNVTMVNCGDFRGRLTIVAERNILIEDHLRYETDPLSVLTSTDALGLIAKDDVLVTTSAPNNLDLQAMILAAGQLGGNRGLFGVTDYNIGSPRGDLNLLGGVVQDLRGAVGTFDAFGPLTGYTRNYTYDIRFLTHPPPYFPTLGNKVRFENWSMDDGI